MRFSTRAIRTVILGGVCFLLSTSPLLAQPGKGECKGEGMHDQDGPHGMFKELNLTEEQKTKLEALRKTDKPLKKQQWEEMKAIRLKSKEELLKDKPDRTVLTKYSKEIAASHQKMAEIMTNHLLKMKEILTKEQFEKLLSKDFACGMHKQCGKEGGKDCPKECPHGEKDGQGPHKDCPHGEKGPHKGVHEPM